MGACALEGCSPPPTGNLPLWAMEGEKASDREEKGGKGREGDRKGATQTDRKTDRHAHSDVHLFDLIKWLECW